MGQRLRAVWQSHHGWLVLGAATVILVACSTLGGLFLELGYRGWLAAVVFFVGTTAKKSYDAWTRPTVRRSEPLPPKERRRLMLIWFPAILFALVLSLPGIFLFAYGVSFGEFGVLVGGLVDLGLCLWVIVTGFDRLKNMYGRPLE